MSIATKLTAKALKKIIFEGVGTVLLIYINEKLASYIQDIESKRIKEHDRNTNSIQRKAKSLLAFLFNDLQDRAVQTEG